MSGPVTIPSGGTAVKDPADTPVVKFDWDTTHLAPGVTIAAFSFAITGPDANLTKDNEALLAGSRATQLRLLGGTVGATYTVTSRITTDESPTQTFERSYSHVVKDL